MTHINVTSIYWQTNPFFFLNYFKVDICSSEGLFTIEKKKIDLKKKNGKSKKNEQKSKEQGLFLGE